MTFEEWFTKEGYSACWYHAGTREEYLELVACELEPDNTEEIIELIKEAWSYNNE